MEDRLQTYEDMHDRFTSPIMRYLDTLSTQMMNVQRDIGTLNDQHDFQEECSTSIDRFRRASLDVKKPTEHLPYTAAEVDQITSKLYTAIDTMEDRFEKRCDDIYFPFDVRLSGLDSHAEWLQKEVKAIQRQFASQHQISASIDSKAPTSTDKHLVASIDTTSTPDAEQLIQNKMESMHEELNEISAYAYDKIGWHQFSIENTQERLQNISNAIHKMDKRWTITPTVLHWDSIVLKMLKWINMSTIHTCLDCLKEPKLTSNTKPDIIACLGAWYTWDRILQKSLEGLIHKDSNKRIRTGLGGGNLQGSLHKEFLDIGQKEVNRAWWQPPLSLDSWKHVGYNELFKSMAKMRTYIESMQHILEKEATTSPSIDANKATSIDVKPQTSQIPAEPESLAEKKDEWEIAYINTKINDVYSTLNNNVDWLSTRIDLLQQDLDTIRKKDQQPATSIDICTITSFDSKFATMEDRLQTYEDMHDRFTSPIMRYLDTLSTQMMNVQRDIGTLNDQHDF
ncbi:hypothetical protein DY000_02005449 [Brassica cretica]|uniref:Uncharacterized protein n=1 Tax=Brassica cretica TaxID=69181 RepID=A0ABQ7BWZ3_BRACR|nr:hypothetical protein DY000_02005449 [Brassica cretica]